MAEEAGSCLRGQNMYYSNPAGPWPAVIRVRSAEWHPDSLLNPSTFFAISYASEKSLFHLNGRVP